MCVVLHLVLGSWSLRLVLVLCSYLFLLDSYVCFLNTHALPGFPNVNTSPQLKPSYGICRDPTTTVGAHRGASCGVGWSFHPDGFKHRRARPIRARVQDRRVLLHQRQHGVLLRQALPQASVSNPDSFAGSAISPSSATTRGALSSTQGLNIAFVPALQLDIINRFRIRIYSAIRI